MPLQEIGWGIIGCGEVTERKSAPAFGQLPHSRLVAVMRRNAELAADYARRHGAARWYNDAQALINDPEVNVVYIATPPALHCEYTLQVAAAGKSVYVEKPMALNTAECETMLVACQTAGVDLLVAYYRRALPRFIKIREWIGSGCIGQVRHVTTVLYRKPLDKDIRGEHHWRIDPAMAGCGYFCDLAPHTIDILQFLVGPIATAYGVSTNQRRLYPAEDSVSAALRFESGAVGAGLWQFDSFAPLDRTEIVGDRGRITFAVFGDSAIRIETGTLTEEYTISNPDPIQKPLIETIIAQLRGLGSCPSTGATAIATNRVMDQILGNRCGDAV